MTPETSCEVHDTYLVSVMRGEWDLDAVLELMQSARETAQQYSITQILFDVMGVSAPISELDRFLVGRQVATLFPWPTRVTVVYPTEQINRFMEDTAVNRGANVLVCDDKADALSWLLDDAPSTAG